MLKKSAKADPVPFPKALMVPLRLHGRCASVQHTGGKVSSSKSSLSGKLVSVTHWVVAWALVPIEYAGVGGRTDHAL